MFSWIRHCVAEVCASPRALLVYFVFLHILVGRFGVWDRCDSDEKHLIFTSKFLILQ